jgi:hypothetical protein
VEFVVHDKVKPEASKLTMSHSYATEPPLVTTDSALVVFAILRVAAELVLSERAVEVERAFMVPEVSAAKPVATL